MNEKNSMPQLSLIMQNQPGTVKCNVYNKNHHIIAYAKIKDISTKEHIYINKIYSVTGLNNIKDGYVSVKEVQTHPVSGNILHIDLHLIESTSKKKVHITIPLKYIGKDRSTDIKRGAYLSCYVKSIAVITSYEHIRPFIEIDVSEMRAGTSLISTAMQMPEGIKLQRENPFNICTLAASKGVES